MTDKISLKNKYEKYVTFDEPIPYWGKNTTLEDKQNNNCLLFYPVMIKDASEFYNYSTCLLTDHTSELDKSLPFDDAMKILSMSCYEYLYYESVKENPKNLYILSFCALLSICLRNEKFKNIVFYKDKFNEFSSIFNQRDSLGKPAFMINQVLYDWEDFDNIKELIAYQNQLELPEIEKDKRFRDAREKAKKLRDRILSEGNSNKMGNLEEQLICLSLGYGLPYNEVCKVSLRKFNKMISYMNKKIHYEIYMSLLGQVEFKDKSVLKHWMTTEDEDKWKDVIMDTDEIDAKINGSDRPQPK